MNPPHLTDADYHPQDERAEAQRLGLHRGSPWCKRPVPSGLLICRRCNRMLEPKSGPLVATGIYEVTKTGGAAIPPTPPTFYR
jgi:hypothetical protein